MAWLDFHIRLQKIKFQKLEKCRVTTGGGGVSGFVTKCHMGEGGLKSAKKCHVLFAWPQICFCHIFSIFIVPNLIKNQYAYDDLVYQGSVKKYIRQTAKIYIEVLKSKVVRIKIWVRQKFSYNSDL